MPSIWIISLLGVVCGAFVLINSLLSAQSAVQQGAAGAVACAFCVIPYVAARAIQQLSGGTMEKARTAALVEIAALQRAAAGQQIPPPPPPTPASSSNTGAVVVGCAVLAVIVFVYFGTGNSPSQANSAAAKACLEFKAIYETLGTPTSSQRTTAMGCQSKGYW